MAALLGKYTMPLLLAALLIAIGGGLSFLAARELSAMVRDARQNAIAERDAFWSGEIAKANAEKADAVAAQLRAIMVADRQIRAAETDANDKLEQMERDNAALPRGDACGLEPERVHLLPQ
ncbi:hypothetical protein [Martelella endophytica]|uniref:Exonuclease SbcC n=1 Tax=Martelella endophytica TaxID=1486262 RepID=A0A0D5LQK8_MAREN|nr:hypothetical protein [Martelella endophytica]AJY46494.1 hypothetical protein TM49_13695 [Martelella endophytica]